MNIDAPLAQPDLNQLLAAFDPTSPAFIADPYPALGALREATSIVQWPTTGQWLVTRYDDVHGALRDRRLGRVYSHRFSPAEFGQPEPDPRWADFREHERWSLLVAGTARSHPDPQPDRQGVHPQSRWPHLRPMIEDLSAEMLGDTAPANDSI